ncbi:MAG TPA: peptidylprolyl isomerase [Candidatus Acidoferrum sp.]|jgi:peptidyl-prolyl cis-trans isomerase SurA|nr:peptidylprolyl isomerase [Candidatus Acidoferrum sp.]
MRKLLLFLAFCGVLPIAILAQDNSANTPQPKPADTQDKSTPTLEKPGMAPATPETAPAKAPAKKTPAPETKVNPNSGRVVEEIIARVNNEIITQSEYEKAKVAAADEAKQDCQGHCTPEQLQIAIEDRQKNALRDLIDQSLLVQRGKDMGLSVEPDVIKKLDQIRIQNNINSMEDLEKAVSAQGVNWEDFKNNIRNGVLTQRVISSEVGSHITIGHDEIEKYYNEHKSEFVRPEQVALRSIEVNTEKKSPEEIVELKKKAETTLKRLKDGEDFGEMAKRFSDGSTAKQGGFLGVYKRGELSKELEDTVFKMRKNDITDVMDTKQGFLILQVLEHYDEGEQTLAKVEPEITDKLYTARMEPAMREYVKTLREQSYVIIKPGYQDIAGGGNSEIQEMSATAEASKKTKKAHKKYGLFGKKPDTGL